LFTPLEAGAPASNGVYFFWKSWHIDGSYFTSFSLAGAHMYERIWQFLLAISAWLMMIGGGLGAGAALIAIFPMIAASHPFDKQMTVVIFGVIACPLIFAAGWILRCQLAAGRSAK
jgi:hypothetical protein